MWAANWLEDQKQRVMINSNEWNWKDFVCFFFPKVLKWLVLAPVLLNCIHHVIKDEWMICAWMKVAGDNKLGRNINRSKELKKKKKAVLLGSFCWSLENEEKWVGEESGGDLD